MLAVYCESAGIVLMSTVPFFASCRSTSAFRAALLCSTSCTFARMRYAWYALTACQATRATNARPTNFHAPLFVLGTSPGESPGEYNGETAGLGCGGLW